MKAEIFSRLARLPALSRSNAADGATHCKICGHRALKFDLVDFNKICETDYYAYGISGISVIYHRCQQCGFIFTSFFDDWTPEDFSRFIYNVDYTQVDSEYAAIRPARIAEEMTSFLADYRAARILDYGSGSGVFAQGLKESGFAEVEIYDPFSSPARPLGQFDIVTCFEAIEHSPAPTEIMADLLSFLSTEGCVIFITNIQPANIEELRGNWWYIAPRNGHVSIYSLAALEMLGAQFGVELYSEAGKLAFARAEVTPRFTPSLKLVKAPTVTARLTAPDGSPPPVMSEIEAVGQPADWHGIEAVGPTRFRWTRSQRVEWRLSRQPAKYPCKLRVVVPVLMEILPGFAGKSVLEVDGATCPLRRNEGGLTASVVVDRPVQQPIVLITSPPQRPSEVRDSADERPLGLAIPI